MNYRDYQNQTNEHIGENIKKYRKEKKLTQQELADKIGKHKITVAKYESGKISVPIDVLDQIANELDVTYIDLIGFDPDYAESEVENTLSAVIEQLEDLGFTIDSDKHDGIYNKITINSLEGDFIKFIDKNTLIDAFNYKKGSLNLKKIFSNSEYDKHILGVTDASNFIDYLEKKDFNIHITDTLNGSYGYVKVLLGNNKYKIDYEKFEELEKELLKYFQNMLLPDYECDDYEWDLED